jgi:hypothetical protein
MVDRTRGSCGHDRPHDAVRIAMPAARTTGPHDAIRIAMPATRTTGPHDAVGAIRRRLSHR